MLTKPLRSNFSAAFEESIEVGAAIFSDEHPSYKDLTDGYGHAVINYTIEYVNGNIHTNTMENFWSLLKRGPHGTYVSVEPFDLFGYLDEQSFRYNNRKGMSDADRLSAVVSQVAGKRLTYAELTGKWEEDRSRQFLKSNRSSQSGNRSRKFPRQGRGKLTR